MLLGTHVSTAGGIDLAIDRIEALGGRAAQIFVQSPRAWRPTEHDPERLKRFRRRRREAGVRYVACHAIYLLNLATADRMLQRRSQSALIATVEIANQIGADVIIHVGSHRGRGLEPALARIETALEPALALLDGSSHLLLENSAGGGGTVGRSIAELAAVIDRLDRHRRLGVCLDTAHLWSSGLDITDPGVVDQLADEIGERIGLRRLRALHVNDTQDPRGANRDVHANIGQGKLRAKLAVLLSHAAFRDLPAILETPGRDGKGPDAAEMGKLRRLCRRAGIATD